MHIVHGHCVYIFILLDLHSYSILGPQNDLIISIVKHGTNNSRTGDYILVIGTTRNLLSL